MPKDVKVPHVLRVVGIDPSTTNMGVCIIDVDLTHQTPFKLVYANTIKGDKVLYDIPVQFDDTAGTGVLARSYCLARALGNLLRIYSTDWEEDDKVLRSMTGICEDNFLGASPGTFKQLIQFVSFVQEQFVNNEIHLSYVLPMLAKEVVGAAFKGTQKEDVREGVMEYKWLDAGDCDLSLLDEHSIDATAVTLFRCEVLGQHYEVFHGGLAPRRAPPERPAPAKSSRRRRRRNRKGAVREVDNHSP